MKATKVLFLVFLAGCAYSAFGKDRLFSAGVSAGLAHQWQSVSGQYGGGQQLAGFPAADSSAYGSYSAGVFFDATYGQLAVDYAGRLTKTKNVYEVGSITVKESQNISTSSLVVTLVGKYPVLSNWKLPGLGKELSLFPLLGCRYDWVLSASLASADQGSGTSTAPGSRAITGQELAALSDFFLLTGLEGRLKLSPAFSLRSALLFALNLSMEPSQRVTTEAFYFAGALEWRVAVGYHF